jgi:hypothetical protein
MYSKLKRVFPTVEVGGHLKTNTMKDEFIII